MIDSLQIIYDKLMQNDFIVDNCKGRIKFYSYPETADVKKPFIIIDPLDVSSPQVYASDDSHYEKHLVQINVESTNRLLTKSIQSEVRKAMKELSFQQLESGLDEYFETTKRYVDARRYEALLKNEE